MCRKHMVHCLHLYKAEANSCPLCYTVFPSEWNDGSRGMEDPEASPRPWQVTENSRTQEDVQSTSNHVLQPPAWSPSSSFSSLVGFSHLPSGCCAQFHSTPPQWWGEMGIWKPFWSLSADSWEVHRVTDLRQLWNAGKLIPPEQLYLLRAKQLGSFSLTTQFSSARRNLGDFYVFSVNGQERRGGRNTNASDFPAFLVVWLVLSLRPLYRCVCRCFQCILE